MISEFQKSIKSVLYDRLTSPFSGALFLSWTVWNWKLLYYLTFSNNDLINRLSFVENNYINIYNNFVYPFISAVGLTLFYPFISTGALWIWLKFKKWQNDIKNQIENKQLLTIEKSIELRFEIRNQEERFNNILSTKTEENLLLKEEVKELQNLLDNKNSKRTPIIASSRESIKNDYSNEFEIFLESPWVNDFEKVAKTIQENLNFIDGINSKVVSYYISNDLVARRKDHNVLYEFTEKGKFFLREYLNQNKQ